jgi:hypothetical protein
MCSTPAQRIAEIGQAIDDLAADARMAYEEPRRPSARREQTSAREGLLAAAESAAAGPDGAPSEDTDHVVLRLAKLWEQLAELDPEVARRLVAYGDLTQR